MSDFSALIASVESYIRQNGNNEITGNILQEVLVGIINTLGTTAINALETGLSTEQTTRANADTALGGRIDTEEGARQQADNALQAAIDAINTKLAEGAVYKGIATPSTTPPAVTGKVFYVAVQGGTYTNFGDLAVTQGLNIIYNSGSSWYVSQVIGIDNEPVQNSTNIVGSGGVYDSVGKKTFVLTFDGKGNALSKGALSTALIAGHKYRFTIKNTNWSVEGITHTSSLYDKFAIIAYNNSEYSDGGSGDVKITIPDPPVKMPEDVLPYYETILPTEVNNIPVEEWWVCADGRAAEGTEVVVVVEDVTIAEMNRKRDIARLLQAGIPVPLNYQDIVYLFEKVPQWDNYLMCVYFNNEGGIYGTENADWWSHKGNLEGAETYRIPLDGYSAVDLYGFSTTFLYGSLITDSEGKALYGITHNEKQYNRWKRQFVAGDMAYLLYTVPAPLRTQEKLLVLYPPQYDFTNRAKDIGSTLSATEPESAGGQIMEIGFDSRAITENQLPAGTDFIEYMGTVEIPVPYGATLRKVYNIMRIGGYSSVTINAARTSENQPCGVFLDANMEVISRYINPVGSSLQLSIPVPSNAVYFVYIFYLAENLSYSLEAATPKNIGEIKSVSDSVALVQGNVAELTGEIVQSNLYVSSTPISGGKGFFLKTNRGYEVHAAHLYDLEGNMVAYNYLPPKGYNSMPYTFFFEDGLRTFYGSCAIPAGYSLVVVFTKYANSIQQEVVTTENVISEFCYLNDGRISLMEHDTANWGYALKKIMQLSSIEWTPKLDVYAAVPQDSSGDYFFKTGNRRFGIPYSEVAEYTKYVGQHVSFYTFLTAILNRRSVMYTERINGSGNSQYGLTYNGLSNRYASSFYGTVCTGLTGYIMGYKNVYISGDYENGNAPNLTLLQNASADNVKPLDIIWSSGHCSVIKDILLDEYGDREYILWAEQTKPTGYITPLTPEMFEKRLSDTGSKVYRYSGWDNTQPASDTPFIQTKWCDYPKNIPENMDVCTMYGDKPCLCVGDVLWLNYIKNKGYDGIVIEKKNGSQWETYDSITLAENPNVREVTDDEEYNDYNLTGDSLQAGTYRAKMVGDDVQDSGYTYWEIIGITLSVTPTANGISVSFSSSNGTPYLLRNEKNSGFMEVSGRDYEITAADITAGSVSLAWTYYENSYIKIFVEGEYGVAVRKVMFPL